MMPAEIRLIPVTGLPRVRAGDDVAALIAGALTTPLQRRDVVVVSHKILSKAQGRVVSLGTVTPSSRAMELAAATDKDPRFVEVVLEESNRIVRHRPGVIIAEQRLGMVMANAGIDRSNVPGDDQVLLLPVDPDGDAEMIRNALQDRFAADVGVVVADSAGRAWRNGVSGLAIGAAGLPALQDLRGREDLEGRPLEVTEVGFADLIASAAHLVMGEADEGCPVVVVRGLGWEAPDRPAADLIRDPAMDLFR
ncbi:MAG: coenzyme F420-0:L-glutamate ligase [Pseudomonadota bacterium]